MKGQFFIISSVIIVYVIIATFQYLSSFGDINLSRISEMHDMSYISQVRDALSQVIVISNASSGCERIDGDLNFTENFLKRELATNGITLTVSHIITNCPSLAKVHVNFSIRDSQTYSSTEFDMSPPSSCPNGVCSSGETCLADNAACEPAVCYASACSNGCTSPIAILAGLTDTTGANQCHDSVGCTPSQGYSCECDGVGNCISSAPQNLAAYWKFDESSGTAAADSSSNGNIVTLSDLNNVSWSGGLFGNAIKISNSLSESCVPSGTDVKATMGPSLSSILSGPFTFSAWRP